MPNRTHEHETEASAALLLLGLRYNLPALIRTAKVKPRPFRRIEPTEAMRANLAAPYFDLVRQWQAERAILLAAYVNALPARGEPLSPDAAASVQRAADEAAVRVGRHLEAFIRRFDPAIARMEQWHRVQWIGRIKAATGIDVAAFTSADEVSAELANAAVVNQQLLRSVHADLHQRASATLTNGLLAFLPIAAMATALNGNADAAKKRVARIAVDQTTSISGSMDRARRRSAGLGRFRWHHTPQRHPRPEHLARDNKVFSQGNAPNDRAGTLPFCQCWEEPLWE